MPQADRDAYKETVLKDTANSFALKKEISSRSFYSSVLSFLCCSGLQRVLSRKHWHPTEKQCRWFWEKLIENSSFLWVSHVPLLITIHCNYLSSFSVSVTASPLRVFGASPIPHLTSAGLFCKLETKIHVGSHDGDFPTVGRVATSFSSVLLWINPWFIQNSQIVQSNLCKYRIWPMAPHVFNGGLRDKQTDPVFM